MDRAQREGSLAATFMLTPSISSSCCPAVFNPANDTVQVGHYGGTGLMLQYRRLSRVYTVQWFWTEHMAPRPHHNSAGSRLSQKYALNFGRSQIIYHPSLPAAQCAPCVFSVSYQTIAICNHIEISFKLSKSIIKGANAAWKSFSTRPH